MFDVVPEEVEQKPSAIELLKELAEEINITIDEGELFLLFVCFSANF